MFLSDSAHLSLAVQTLVTGREEIPRISEGHGESYCCHSTRESNKTLRGLEWNLRGECSGGLDVMAAIEDVVRGQSKGLLQLWVKRRKRGFPNPHLSM